MAEFVAECAYGCEAERIVGCAQAVFRRYGIGPDFLSVEGESYIAVSHIPGMRPDKIVDSGFRLVLSGHDEEDIVHLPVLVDIIKGEIYSCGICQLTSLSDSLAGIVGILAAVIAVAAVFGVAIAQCDNRGYVEYEFVVFGELVLEIALYLGGEILEVLIFECHLLVAELRRNDQASLDNLRVRPCGRGIGGCRTPDGLGMLQPKFSSPEHNGSFRYYRRFGHDGRRNVAPGDVPRAAQYSIHVISSVTPESVLTPLEYPSVGISYVMEKFIAVNLGLNDGPVRLPERNRTRISLFGYGRISRNQQGQQNADFVSFHISVHVMRTLNCSATICKITDYI